MRPDRKIVAFSISHDNCAAHLYGHYSVLDSKKIKYYRRTIRKFDFSDPSGELKWTAYRFVMNIYDPWAPDHFKRICSAVKQLPTEEEVLARELEETPQDVDAA